MYGRFSRGFGVLFGILLLALVGVAGYQIGLDQAAAQVVTTGGAAGAAVPVYVGHAGWGFGFGFGFLLFPLFFFLLIAFAFRPRWSGHHGYGSGRGFGPGPWGEGGELPPDDPRVQWIARAHRRLHEADATGGNGGQQPPTTS